MCSSYAASWLHRRRCPVPHDTEGFPKTRAEEDRAARVERPQRLIAAFRGFLGQRRVPRFLHDDRQAVDFCSAA